MDYLRTAYTTRMKLWTDSDETVEVRWFRADPNAKLFTGRKRFSSLTWCDSKKPEFAPHNDGVGEQTEAGRQYDRGVNLHGLTGQNFCGGGAAWEHGGTHGVDPPLALGADGVPLCCGRVFQATGGEVQGGTRGPQAAVQLGRGGEAQGGAGLVVPGVVFVGVGGQGQGGVALTGGRFLTAALGGSKEGGVAPFRASSWVSAGGQAEGGTGRFIPSVWQSAGGQGEGGVAAQHGFPLSTLGGEAQGGAALFIEKPFRSAGGEVQGGTSSFSTLFFVVSGGEAQGGIAWQIASFPQASRGGSAESGISVVPAAFIQRSAGGSAESGFSTTFAQAPQASRGGEMQRGTTVFRFATGQTTSGGQLQGGSTLFRFAVGQVSAGGQQQGGSSLVEAEDVIPGTIIAYGGSGAVPAGYLACDGSAVSRTTYAALFGAIGTTWGAGDGSTTFAVPNIRGRALVSPGGLAAVGAVGTAGGAPTVTLAVANLPSHTHDVPGVTRTANVTGNANNFERGEPGQANDPLTSTTAGTGTAFNIMPPYSVVQWLIKT